MSIIENFKHSQDYIDIGYMVTHVNDLNLRLSCLEDLGYRIGVNVVKIDSKVMDITIGKNKDIRIQVTPNIGKLNIAKCVVIK